jgi:hemerythrin
MFEWNDRYSVGIGSIDAQHQTLFGLAAELHNAMSAGQGKAASSKVLDRLIQYTATHFAHEERLMRLHDFPGLEPHKAQHEALTKRVRQFQADFQSGRVTITIQLLQFLKNWLESHIKESDQEYAPYLKSKAVA